MDESLEQQFLDAVDRACSKTGELLRYCYIKRIDCYWERLAKHGHYFVVYCPSMLFAGVRARQDFLRTIARSLSLDELICVNARRLLRDPGSTLKQKYPSLWLDLQWIETHAQGELDRENRTFLHLRKLSQECASGDSGSDCFGEACGDVGL